MIDYECIKSKNGGYVLCDGILIKNVYNIILHFDENKMVLTYKDDRVIGVILNMDSRKTCVFGEKIDGVDAYDEKWLVYDGQVLVKKDE